jgi:predicted nucleic acid-binding protein
MNEALLDVNLLIACVVENHVDHRRAKKFLASLERFYTTPMTQGGFLRFMTRPWKDEKKAE